MKALPERLIATTRLHFAEIENIDGRLMLRNGHRIPPTLKAALKQHKIEVLQMLTEEVGRHTIKPRGEKRMYGIREAIHAQ